MKKPEDLGVVTKSKRLILWEKVKVNCLASIERYNDELEISGEMLKMAEVKIAEENAR